MQLIACYRVILITFHSEFIRHSRELYLTRMTSFKIPESHQMKTITFLDIAE